MYRTSHFGLPFEDPTHVSLNNDPRYLHTSSGLQDTYILHGLDEMLGWALLLPWFRRIPVRNTIGRILLKPDTLNISCRLRKKIDIFHFSIPQAGPGQYSRHGVDI